MHGAQGTARLDKCSVCVGGNTGNTGSTCTPDCKGQWYTDPSQKAVVDACKVCGGDCVDQGDGTFTGACACKKTYTELDIKVPPIGAALLQNTTIVIVGSKRQW